MPSHRRILAIDVGTSAVKVGLFDHALRLHESAAAAYRVDRPHPGWAEVPPRRWWDAMCRAAGRAVGNRGRSVEAVTFSTLYPGLILADSRLRPLRPAILYCDNRSGPEGRAFEDRIGRHRLHARTGSTVHPGTPALSSLVWVGRHEPDVLRRTRHLLMPNAYLAARLTGAVGLDYNTASLSGLLDVRRKPAWWTGLAGEAGLDPAALPPLMPSDAVVGRLTAGGARALGLPTGVPVVIGAGDSACTALAAGLLRPGRITVACGSTDTAAACTTARPLPPGLINVVHAAPGPDGRRCLAQASLSSAGVSVDWIVAGLFGTGREAFARALREAEAAPGGAGGMLFLPYLQGERTPIWSDTARGVLVGLTPGADRGAIVRAVLEGVAFALRHNVEALETGVGRQRPTVTLLGGGARSRLLNRIRADVLGRPVRRLCLREAEGSEALAVAAMLAAAGIGWVASFKEAADRIRAIARVEGFRPRRRAAERYEGMYEVYRGLFPALRPAFEALHRQAGGGKTRADKRRG